MSIDERIEAIMDRIQRAQAELAAAEAARTKLLVELCEGKTFVPTEVAQMLGYDGRTAATVLQRAQRP